MTRASRLMSRLKDYNCRARTNQEQKATEEKLQLINKASNQPEDESQTKGQ